MSLDRRTVLELVGLGAGTTLAGCLGRSGGANGESGRGDGDEDGNRGESDGGGIVDYDVLPYLVEGAPPRWYRADGDATGRVIVIDSEVRARAVLRDDVDESRGEALADLLEEIDYGGSVLLVVESVGPDLCYDELAVSDVRLEDGRIRGTAEAIDTGDPDTVCGAAVTFPSAVVRVDFADEPATEAAFSITDGWGETSIVEAAADDSLSPAPADLDGYVQPDGDPEAIAPLECGDEEFERYGNRSEENEVSYGELAYEGEVVFALRVEETVYERGDVARIRLTNVSDRLISSGNRHRYALEAYTEAGWQDVRGWVDGEPKPYTDEAIDHRPGEGFEWSLELTEAGLVADHVHTDDLVVCPDLLAGRYRFAFRGIVGGSTIAVQFDLE